MNYQDMLGLKKGDSIFVGNVAGEVTGKGSLCGSPALWLKYIDRHGNTRETLFSVGACWKESAWYNFGKHLQIRWQSELKEKHSMENRYEQESLF